jgi:biopolymer transport protein ExbD
VISFGDCRGQENKMSAGNKKGLKKMAAHVGPNMTPMVDIVMCILIFFMLSMTFAGAELFLTSNMVVSDKGLATEKSDVIDIPKLKIMIKIVPIAKDPNRPDAVSSIGGKAIVSRDNPLLAQPIRIGRPDQVDPKNTSELKLEQELNDQMAAQLTAVRKNVSNDVLVVLAPDVYAPYEDVIKVYDACVKAQFPKVAFAPADAVDVKN